MIDSIFIFGAEKLYILSPLIVLYFFYKLPKQKKIDLMVFAFFTLPLAYLLGEVARHFFSNPRPFVVKGIEPLIHHAPDNGFPSDHALLLSSIAAIIHYFDKRYAIALWTIMLLVSISRIYANLHHVVDIAASVCIALLSAVIVYATIAAWNKNNPTNSSSPSQ